jgi:hypothetical protein
MLVNADHATLENGEIAFDGIAVDAQPGDGRVDMRNLVQPPPSMHCELCHGGLRLRLIEPDEFVS